MLQSVDRNFQFTFYGQERICSLVFLWFSEKPLDIFYRYLKEFLYLWCAVKCLYINYAHKSGVWDELLARHFLANEIGIYLALRQNEFRFWYSIWMKLEFFELIIKLYCVHFGCWSAIGSFYCLFGGVYGNLFSLRLIR